MVNRAFDWLKLSRNKHGTSQQATPVTILGIGIGHSERSALEELAPGAKWQLRFSNTPQDAVALLCRDSFAIVLCDRDLPGTNWRSAMEKVKLAAPSASIVLVSGVSDEYLWQEVVKYGGFDVLMKPFLPDPLRRRIDGAWLFWKAEVERRRTFRN
jgi:DNA-binding NtrC family response regulator